MDLDINKRLEEENKKEMAQALEQEERVKQQPKKVSDKKFLFIAAAVIIGIIAFSLSDGFGLYEQAKVTGSAIAYTLQDLHRENLAGNLDKEVGIIYNGFSVVKYEGLWWTRKETEDRIIEFPLHFNPLEVEEIEITGNLAPEFNKGEDVFIAIDPGVKDKFYTLALSELSFNVVKGLDRRPVGSCTVEDPVCETREIISCEKNPQLKPVIELTLGNESKIESFGTCIKVTGQEYELVKAVDKLLYRWYRVME